MSARLGRLVTALALLAATITLQGCGPETEEGSVRPFVREGRAGLVIVEGSEIFQGGEWLKQGNFIFRDELGEEIAKGAYEAGLEEGPWQQRYEDGSTGVGSFKAGEREGMWRTFHKNGKLQDTGLYSEGLRTGRWASLRPDGTRLREAEYVAGKKEGPVTWYLKDGTTVDKNRSGTYKNDELVK